MLHPGNTSSYVCARCLFRANSGFAISALNRSRTPRARDSVWLLRRQQTPLAAHYYSVRERTRYLQGLATVQHSSDASSPKTTTTSQPEGDIRARLRAWEAANPAPAVVYARDTAEPRAAVNTLIGARLPDADFFEAARSGGGGGGGGGNYLDHDAIDLRTEATGFLAGDLLEISSDSWRIPLLAVCLGTFNGHDHFYTDTGKWFASQGVRTQFVVKNFIPPPTDGDNDDSDLQAIIDALPSTSGSARVLDVLEDLKAGPSRERGASLIARMHAFRAEAGAIHQRHADRLARTRELLLGPEERVLGLVEIAEQLLPSSLKMKHQKGGGKEGGKFTPAALYAVHTALGLDSEVLFRPVSHGSQQSSYLYRVSSATDGTVVDLVEDMVRDFFDDPLLAKGIDAIRDSHFERSPFGQFVLRARRAVDESRRWREWSSHGVLGPYKKSAGVGAVPMMTSGSGDWTVTDKHIIRFVALWAAHDRFSRASRLHWIGSAILRAVARYQDVEVLSSSVGWTFLQEIGHVRPWDIQSRYSLQLPGGAGTSDKHGGVTAAAGGEGGAEKGKLTPSLALAASLRPDPCAGIRKRWAETIYCIDAESAREIDDGISLQAADDNIPEGQQHYWIHVHIADPASRIKPHSLLADHAARMSQSSYLAGFHEAMFGAASDSIHAMFSLAPDRPCLTFSAKVDDQGTLLDYTITPGTVGDKVVYITGDDVSALCGEEDTDVPQLGLGNYTPPFSVGTPPTADEALPPNRKMSKPEELDDKDTETLQTLSRLTRAIHEKRLAKGAMPFYFPRPTAEVSLHGTTTQIINNDDADTDSVHYSGDPYIRISYEGGSGNPLVSSAMQLAGEVAARWCQERNIPVPYRVQPRAAQNADLLRSFTRDVLYPQLLQLASAVSGRRRQRPAEADYRTMRALVGGVDVSTVPGPNFTMGLDLYTKATSPLRRFADMLVHWQVHAALEEERRRGLDALLLRNSDSDHKDDDDDAYLPFSRTDLETRIFPLLRVRERHTKLLDNVEGNAEWILQALVRAWKFDSSPSSVSSSAFSSSKSELEGKLPPTFHFTVHDVPVGPGSSGVLTGQLDWFERFAQMERRGLAGVAALSDVKAGDVLEVVLQDVNVHARQIWVRAVGRVESV